jgi:hypothetical protein
MKEYFKPVPRFQKPLHPFDIGRAYSWWPGNYDRHFLNNVYERQESEFEEFYQYHLSYFFDVNPGADEVTFYKKVRRTVEDGITRLIQEDRPNSKLHHAKTNIHKDQLRAFLDFLNGIDQWHVRPPFELLAEKDATITRLQMQIQTLEKQLIAAKEYDVAQKIMIEESHLPTVVDLIQQLRDLKLPTHRSLVRCDHKTPYYKMISKYFSIGGKDIPIETAKNYFSDKTEDVGIKGTAIPPQNKLFKIIPVSVSRGANQRLG